MAYLWGGYTRCKTCAREKVGLSEGGLIRGGLLAEKYGIYRARYTE